MKYTFLSLVLSTIFLGACSVETSSKTFSDSISTTMRYVEDVVQVDSIPLNNPNATYYTFGVSGYSGLINLNVGHSPTADSDGFDKKRICYQVEDGQIIYETQDDFLVEVHKIDSANVSDVTLLGKGEAYTLGTLCKSRYILPVESAGEYYVQVRMITDDVMTDVTGFRVSVSDIDVLMVSDGLLSLQLDEYVMGGAINLRRDTSIAFGQRWGFFVAATDTDSPVPMYQVLSPVYSRSTASEVTTTTYHYTFDVNDIDPSFSNHWTIEACAFDSEGDEDVTRMSCDGEEVIGRAAIWTTLL